MPAARGSALGCWHLRRANKNAYCLEKSCYCYTILVLKTIDNFRDHAYDRSQSLAEYGSIDNILKPKEMNLPYVICRVIARPILI